MLLFVGLALAENMILHPMAKVDLSGIDSEYAILVDAGTGFKLAGKAEKEQMYPASCWTEMWNRSSASFRKPAYTRQAEETETAMHINRVK